MVTMPHPILRMGHVLAHSNSRCLKIGYHQQIGKLRLELNKGADPMAKKWCSYLLISINVLFLTGLVSCGIAKITTKPAPISTITPASRYTATPFYTPTSPPNARLSKLATLGEGVLPQIIYSHDGTKVFLSDGYSLRILNEEDQKENASIEISEDGYGGVIEISPDDRYIIFTGLFGFNVLDINSEEVVAYGYGGNGSAVGPVFTEDSRFVVYRAADRSTGGPYHSICSIDLNVPEVAEEGQNCYPTLPNYRYGVMSDPAVSPNGEIVAAGYSDSTHNILYIWDLQSKAILYEIKEQPSQINSVAFSLDGSLLATAGNDGIVRLWNPHTGDNVRSIIAFTDDINDVEFSQNGKRLVVSVKDQPTITYDLATGKTEIVKPEPLDPISIKLLQQGYMLAGNGSKIRFSPDGKSVAVAHGSLQVWDVETRKLKVALLGEKPLGITGMVYSPDGEHIAIVTQDGDVYAWDLRTGEQEFYVSASTLLSNQVFYASGGSSIGPGIGTGVFGEQSVAFSPDASKIALANGSEVELWNINTANKEMTLALKQPVKYPTKISFSNNGEYVYAVLNRNQDVAIWNAKTGELVRQLNLPHVDPNAFSATDLQGQLFARNNYDEMDFWIEIWNLETGQMTKIPTFQREVEPLRFSTDGLFFAALVNHDQLYVWRTDTGQLAYISEPGLQIGDFAISPQGKLLATAEYGKVTVWDLHQFSDQALQPGFISLAMPPTPTPWDSSSDFDYPTPTAQPTQVVQPLTVPSMGPEAISTQNISNLQLLGRIGQGRVSQIQWAQDGNTVRVTSSQGLNELDPNTLDTNKRFETEAYWVTSSQLLPDGRLLEAGFTDEGTIQVWDVSNGKMLGELKGYGEPAISPDGKWLIYEIDDGLATWNIENGQPGKVLHSSYDLSWPTFSPNSHYVAAIQSDYSVRVWDITTGVIIKAAGGPEAEITDLSFSPDGNYLVGAAGGTAWVWSLAPSLLPIKWDLFTGNVNGNLTLFDNTVTAVATNMDNSLLAVGTSQGRILLFDQKNANLLGNLEGLASSLIKMAFSPDSTLLLSVDEDGQTILWDVANRKPIAKRHDFIGRIAGLGPQLDGNISAWMQNTVWTISPTDMSKNHSTYIPAKKILAVSPSGDLVAGYTPLKVTLYDAKSGKPYLTLSEEAEDVWVEYYWEGDILRQFYGALFSPEGKTLTTYGAGGMWMYTLPEGKLVGHWEGNNTRKASVSPDGNWLVASDFENMSPPKLINFETGEEIFLLSIPYGGFNGVGRQYANYAISPDKRWVGLLRYAIGDSPSRLELVDTTTGLLARALDFKDSNLVSLAFNPSGTLIAIGQSNGTVALVDTANLEVLTTFKAHLGPVTSLIFSPDGARVISAGEDGIINSWGLP